MILWSLEVGPVANAREGSTQEHDWARDSSIHEGKQHFTKTTSSSSPTPLKQI